MSQRTSVDDVPHNQVSRKGVIDYINTQRRMSDRKKTDALEKYKAAMAKKRVQ